MSDRIEPFKGEAPEELPYNQTDWDPKARPFENAATANKVNKRDWAIWDAEHPWVSTGRTPEGEKPTHDAVHSEAIVKNLAAGETATVPPTALPGVIAACKESSEPVNLHNLDITGAENSHLFSECTLCLPRVEMPVISDTADAQRFTQELQEKGISASWEEVDPKSLIATQNELDGIKVAGITTAMESHGGEVPPPPTPVLVVDQHGSILDGHHRWAAAAAYSVSHPDYKVSIVRVNTDIGTLVPLGHKYDASIPGHEKAKAFGQTQAQLQAEHRYNPKADPAGWATPPNDSHPPALNKPYFWIAGKGWVLMATDTADGVPRQLNFPPKQQLAARARMSPVQRRATPFPELSWRGGYPQALVDWYNDGADGAINWGEDGDFEDCVAVASKYIDNPEGFCNLRHQDATGAPPGKAAGEEKTSSVLGSRVRRWHPTTRDWAAWDAEHEGSWSAKAITEDEARGNSRPVSAQEYEQLANTGQQRLAEIEANTRPMSAFNDDTKWSAIKESAYSECQKPWGGQTIDPQSGQVIHPSTGYALTIRPAGATQISVPENATADELAAAMDQAKEKYSDQLQGAATYLGVFHDDDEHRIDVDPVVHVADTKDVETIGAYTHASGGAYDFATGDGYFPPHVGGMKQLSDQYVKTGKPTSADVDTMIHNYQVMHGTMPSDSAIAKLHKKAGM